MQQVKKTRMTGVPKFLRHLYSILTVEDSTIISWSDDGMAIQLFDIKRLEKFVLPKYFKHNKLSSFQRQLNYFGFRKWTKTQSNICTFSHVEFNRNTTPETMTLSRKKTSSIDTLHQLFSIDDIFPSSDQVVDFDLIEPLKIDSNQQELDWQFCLESLTNNNDLDILPMDFVA
ncbi:hypothetical protein THRCLA_21674 [Thraustotheca clavata]|uniref:HSF-type DNA-binding domain-containing protein n=1 Tax=Thraustotheca clavata TaxID=74557 RepID=A0A1V9ZRH8_9STRA|nr:hypothetical protein THRCLA_21674 [Thraustotheca clavata]